MKYLVPVGRLMYVVIFLMTIKSHFSASTAAFAAKQGVPFASIAVPLSGVMAIVGGLSILFGYKAKYGAWLIVLFLVVITPVMHNFWAVSDPVQRGMQMTNFLKNLSMLGAALMITYFGSGPCSLDNLGSARRKR